jgi:hypothetical protein
MMVLMYSVPIAAWLSFIYVQHHWGDRPTTVQWWAAMTGIGSFEIAKGFFGLFPDLPVVSMALAAGIAAALAVLIVHWRRTWTALEPESGYADAY